MEQFKTVIVGKYKPLLNYVTACITIFNQGEQSLTLRARGEAINNSVEVFHLLKNRFLEDVGISNVLIDGETVTTKHGKLRHLPVLEITLHRGFK
ncbi:MAG: RNA-binding protein [Thaumarchaeota archaeon]|nr:RNA-binding protein [Nitrososphaerota archaeon]